MGGHVISMARALSFNGLANAQMIVGLNGGSHVAPLFAGDTICAWSEVLDKAETTAAGVGAVRLRLVAHKPEVDPFVLKGDDGKYAPGRSVGSGLLGVDADVISAHGHRPLRNEGLREQALCDMLPAANGGQYDETHHRRHTRQQRFGTVRALCSYRL